MAEYFLLIVSKSRAFWSKEPEKKHRKDLLLDTATLCSLSAKDKELTPLFRRFALAAQGGGLHFDCIKISSSLEKRIRDIVSQSSPT